MREATRQLRLAAGVENTVAVKVIERYAYTRVECGVNGGLYGATAYEVVTIRLTDGSVVRRTTLPNGGQRRYFSVRPSIGAGMRYEEVPPQSFLE